MARHDAGFGGWLFPILLLYSLTEPERTSGYTRMPSATGVPQGYINQQSQDAVNALKEENQKLRKQIEEIIDDQKEQGLKRELAFLEMLDVISPQKSDEVEKHMINIDRLLQEIDTTKKEKQEQERRKNEDLQKQAKQAEARRVQQIFVSSAGLQHGNRGTSQKGGISNAGIFLLCILGAWVFIFFSVMVGGFGGGVFSVVASFGVIMLLPDIFERFNR